MLSLDRPVSDFLEADLAETIRQKGIVLWLDLDDSYSRFVERLSARRAEGEFKYPVVHYQGSYLELLQKMGPVASGVEMTPLLIHLPGFNEQRVHGSPLLELWELGHRYRKALDTLVVEAATGRVSPQNLEQARALRSKSLEDADAWLAKVLSRDAGSVSAELRTARPEVQVEDLLVAGPIATHTWGNADRAKPTQAAERLRATLQAWLGIADSWSPVPEPTSTPEDLAFYAVSWAMAVEYSNDLAREPIDPRLMPMRALPKTLIEACGALARHLRARHPDVAVRMADETEALFPDEVAAAQAEDLGKIDTFRFEEQKVLLAALVALEEGAWAKAAAWAKLRLGTASLWLTRYPHRESAWDLVALGARLGLAVEAAGPVLEARDLSEAVRRYEKLGAEVDQAHRHLEQQRRAQLYPDLPEYQTLRTRLDAMRTVWRGWADGWARSFSMLCKERGFRPPPALEQRTIFEDIVAPMARDRDAVACFMVDAMRFEIGEELRRAIVDAGAAPSVRLEARLAELPSVTEMGMNALAPVNHDGRLTVALSTSNGKHRIEGIRAGEFRVHSPETRKRAIHERVGGATCPLLTLEEVKSSDRTTLKQRIAKARLIIVHSRELDEVGEVGAGPSVFDSVVQDLRAAYRLLRDAGVRRFVFTADHGFLLLDDNAN